MDGPWCRRVCREVAYELIHQPVPCGLLSGIIAGAKVLLIDLMKQCRNQVCLHPLRFCRLCMTMLLISFFYIPTWVFTGDSLFQLAIGDIIITSYHFHANALPLLDESSNQRLSHLDTPSCMHFNHQEGLFPASFFIQLSERKHVMLTAHQHRKYIVYFGSYSLR